MQVVLSLVVALVAALLGPKFLSPYLPSALQPNAPVAEKPAQESGEPEVKETAFQRVMRTGTIKCGYSVWAPYVMKDPNTGAMSGINYDYVEALGRLLNLKIDWSQETNIGTIIADLNANKVDLACTSLWPDAGRMRNLTHTIPSIYSNMYAWVRADDERFLSGDVRKANSPDFIIAGIDSDTTSDIIRTDFPQAKVYNLPQMSDPSMLIEAVATKKADMLIVDEGSMQLYLKANPGKLRKVSPEPLKVFGEHFAVKLGEHDFVNMLNTAMTTLNNSPAVEEMLKKYPSSMVPATRTYDATWLERRPTPLPAAEQVQTQDVPAPTPAPEATKETETAPAQPSNAGLEKPAEAAPATEEKAPDVKAEPKADEKVAAPEKTPEKTSETTPEAKAEVKPDAAKETDTKADTEKTEPKKEATKPTPAAPPAPTLGDVKDALDKARAVAAQKAAEAANNNLPPGVTAPQPLTGAGATRGVITPSLPNNTISPTTAQ